MSELDRHTEAIVAGDPDAFGRWVAGAEPLLRLRLRPFAARVDTEAVLQEALLRLWQVAPRWQPDGREDGLVRLASRIARNLAIDELRRARMDLASIEAIEQAAGELAHAPSDPDPLLRAIVERCREHLPAKPAAALGARLASAGGDPDQVLAARLGMQPNTFLQNFTRARKLLAACLEREGVDLAGELA
jgi:RNA polymerase sigma-70 factor (ECF subfamily)